jgi:hypothetical protein
MGWTLVFSCGKCSVWISIHNGMSCGSTSLIHGILSHVIEGAEAPSWPRVSIVCWCIEYVEFYPNAIMEAEGYFNFHLSKYLLLYKFMYGAA